MKQKLCVPITTVDGLNSIVSDHFGRAEHHAVIELSSNRVSILDKENECSDESHGNCLPVDLLLANDISLVACKGIGRGAVNRLRKNDIRVFSTTAKTVQDVINAYRLQALGRLSEEQICTGHHS